MRLNEVLSRRVLSREYEQVEGFLVGRKGIVGQQVTLSIGKVMLNYYCTNCNDNRTFISEGDISCIFASNLIISIDCILTCGCGTDVRIWYLVESENDIRANSPKVRVLKRGVKFSDNVKVYNENYGGFSVLLEKAEHAYREDLGAGAIVYLRKAFEQITKETADEAGIEYPKYANGNPKNFRNLLENVDAQNSIIPMEFSRNGYRLFRDLSNIIHGEYNDDIALSKYSSLQRLIIGILDNVKNNSELMDAIGSLDWNEEEEVT